MTSLDGTLMKTIAFEIITDPETGMPVLPDGEFWRVRQEIRYFEEYLVVELRKKRKFFWGSKVLAVKLKSMDSLDSEFRQEDSGIKFIKKQILLLANSVIEEQLERVNLKLRQERLDGIIKSYSGDYPPLKL